MNTRHMNFHGNKEPVIRLLAMPKDTNPQGDIFGGWIMSQVDIAGAIIAMKLSKGKVATVAVTDFTFKKPVYVGDLISCYGNVKKVGKTSITIQISVCAQRERISEECVKVTEATLVYVAIDENRNPREIEDKSENW